LADGPGTFLVFNEVIGDLLVDALMGSGVVVALDVLLDNLKQLMVIENEHVIETFALQAANEALTE
jgi:hypothetical protein